MKNKNILLMLEEHVDKLVLGAVALVCLVLLWIYVIGNPYGAKVDGRKQSPSQIDRYVKQRADQLSQRLDDPADPVPFDKTDVSRYEQKLQCSIADVTATAVLLPLPGAGQVQIMEDRLYALPEIPSLFDVQAGHLRGAAQVPASPVGPDQPYETVPKELEDVDLVTVSSHFDIQALFNNFQQSFTGPRLKTSWKDPRLARPIFARMDLQRRARQDDGTWSPWESVSRTQVDTYQKLLQELPLSLEQSQFGVDIWSSQYDRQEVQFDILQPEAYSFMISRVEWMPPEFLDEALTILAREEDKAKRDLQEQRQRQRDTRTTADRTRTTTQRPTRTRPQPDTRARGRETESYMMETAPVQALPTRTAPRERTLNDVKKDLDKALLSDKTNLSSLRDPVLVWAHDDTAMPGTTYQYRIRLGVFNPIAGKDWFIQDQADFKDRIVLWSSYSEPTPAISIPRRVYVFPTDVIAQKDAPAQVEAVQVEVAKYQLGRWHDHEFEVIPGQIIGYEVKDEDKKNRTPDIMGGYGEGMTEMGMGLSAEPEIVDFSTDYTLVDVHRQTLWGSRLRPKTLYQMLYCNEDQNLAQLAIGKTNWDSRTRQVYAEIQEALEQDIQQRSPGMMPGIMDPMIMNPMMMDPMRER